MTTQHISPDKSQICVAFLRRQGLIPTTLITIQILYHPASVEDVLMASKLLFE